MAHGAALMSHIPTFRYSRKKQTQMVPLHSVQCGWITNTTLLEAYLWTRRVILPPPFIYSFFFTSRFLCIHCHLCPGSWNLIYVFPPAFLLSPLLPGMPQSPPTLPSVWSRISADLQQIVYFARHGGSIDGLFIGSRFTAELWPGSSATWVQSRAPL